MQAMTPITPLEPGVEMFERALRGKNRDSLFSSHLTVRSSLERPLSGISVAYTDIEDDSSEFEEYSGSSSDNRRSQTTISTFEEIQTPGDELRPQHVEWYLPKAVEGPRGPHLFRASVSSNDFDYALQMSPLVPKDTHSRFPTFAREPTPATIVPQQEYNNIASAVAHLDNNEVRAWSSRDVATWMYQNGFEDDVIDKFVTHDITGAVLLDLQFDDLKELEIESFGKRHQLWHQIDSLRAADGLASPIAPAPIPTPFEDIERPCTEARERSKSKGRIGRRRRNLGDDLITPAESVSIVAIEQLLPKPHVCAKGERCAKWRKQQRQLARLQEEHGFPISPEKGGKIFIAGDPGNAHTAQRAVENVHRPVSDAEQSVIVPSVVASSDILGPGQLPEFSLQDLQHLEQRDPQDHVRHFLSLQGMDHPYATATPIEAPPTPPMDMFPPRPQLIIPQTQHYPQLIIPQTQHYPQISAFSASTSAHTMKFDPATLPTPVLYSPETTPAPHSNLRSLPKLTIPRSMSAQPQGNPRHAVPQSSYVVPDTAFSPACETAVTPGGIYRFGTPASMMDVPVTAVHIEPVARDTSQSVPPNMQYKIQLQRTGSRNERRRPSLTMPALNENHVFTPTGAHSDDDNYRGTQFFDNSPDSSPTKETELASIQEAGDRLAPLPSKGGFDYKGVNHHGWMKKRKTKMLRHEWQDHHFRLNGTMLAMHPNELPSSSALQTIDVDDYAVACSSLASNKLSARLRALKLSSSKKEQVLADPSAFEFQLVPTIGETKKVMPHGKVHHFATKGRDERIDWMRELMLAKALKAKAEGYEVTVNGAGM